MGVVLDLQTGEVQAGRFGSKHWVPDMLDPPPTLLIGIFIV